MIPTKRKFEVTKGPVFLCDMRPGVTEEGVQCRLPKGKYDLSVFNQRAEKPTQFSLILEGATPDSERKIGTFSIDMARVGVLEMGEVLPHFGGDSEQLFEWSSGAPMNRFECGGFMEHHPSGLETLVVNLREDCTCTVAELKAGKRTVGLRVIPNVPGNAFSRSLSRPYGHPGHTVNKKCLLIDLLEDQRTILKYFKQRMADYPVYENYGPGKDEDSIKSITIGFDTSDCSWVSLVFDTRKTNNRDWTSYVDSDLNLIEFPQWNEAIIQLEAEQIVYFKESTEKIAYFSESRGKGVHPCLNSGFVSILIRQMLEGLVVPLRKSKELASLPLATGATLQIDSFDGEEHWPNPRIRISDLHKIGKLRHRK